MHTRKQHPTSIQLLCSVLTLDLAVLLLRRLAPSLRSINARPESSSSRCGSQRQPSSQSSSSSSQAHAGPCRLWRAGHSQEGCDSPRAVCAAAQLAQCLLAADADRDGLLTLGSLKRALAAAECSLTEAEVRLLFTHLDLDGVGHVEAARVARLLRPPMSDRRRACVQLAFQKVAAAAAATAAAAAGAAARLAAAAAAAAAPLAAAACCCCCLPLLLLLLQLLLTLAVTAAVLAEHEHQRLHACCAHPQGRAAPAVAAAACCCCYASDKQQEKSAVASPG